MRTCIKCSGPVDPPNKVCNECKREANRKKQAALRVRRGATPYVERTVAERFWEKVAAGGDDECWEWTASRHQFGYGQLMVNKRPIGAHRISYELHHGAIPEGMFVCHRCDNPPCCNPAHLFLGSSRDNLDDMTAKGRRRGGGLRGVNSPRAKLTEPGVRAIRKRYAAGGVTLATLAEEYGVSLVAIHQVVTRLTWAHVAD